jgi:hypothetical protein
LQNSGLGLPTTLGLSTTQQQIIELSEQIIDLAETVEFHKVMNSAFQ